MKPATNREFGVQPRMLVVVAACAACHGAFAQQADITLAAMDSAALAPRSETLPRVEITRSALPRLESLDGPMGGQRLDLTVLPPRRTLGLALGMTGFQPRQPVAGQFAQPLNVDLGLTWRHTTEGNHQIDVSAWRRVTPQPDAWTLIHHRQPTYVARVEYSMAGAGAKSGLVADRGFLGLQLENGARISLKRKNGGAMIYYRKKF